jgi:cyanophycinase
MRPIVLALGFACLSAQAQTTAPQTIHRATPGYDTYLTGNPADVSPVTKGGLQLEGGGTDIPEAFRWLIAHAGGGDIVVIRASGADGYNRFIMDLGPVDSVESIVFHRREASFDPEVLDRLQHAEAVFIAGGDQANYVRFWKDTPLQATLNALARRGVPVGGTSAGLAVLGEFSFAALEDTVTSAEALADPYSPKVTLERGFLALPRMNRIITDSHFVPRDRLGRLLVFLARIVQDGWSPTARAIAVDQEAALLVEADGSAAAVGKGSVYFMETTSRATVCRPGLPLTIDGIRTVRVAPGGSFDLTSWSGPGATPYMLSVQAGKVESSTGSIY